MRTRRSNRGAGEGGWALVFAVLVTFIAGTMASLMFLTGMSANRIAKVQLGSTEALYLAEGALAAAEQAIIDAIANWQAVPTEGTATIGDHVIPYTVTPTGFVQTTTDASGILTVLRGFEIEATAESHGTRHTAHRIVNSSSTPIFQFAVFYTNDLEILPGPSMRLGGRVHTNADMYLGCGKTLSMDTNYVRATGDIFRARKDDPSVSAGEVEIRSWVVDPFDPSEPSEFVELNGVPQMDDLGIATTSGYDSNFTDGHDADGDGLFTGPDDFLPWTTGALEYWEEPESYAGGSGNTVMTSDHGVQEAVAPSIGSIAMFEEKAAGDHVWNTAEEVFEPVAAGAGTHSKGFFHAQSDLSILATRSGKWVAYDGDGKDVTSFLSYVVSIETMYDARQGGKVQVIEVDIEELNDSGMFPSNGLLYSSTTGLGEGTAAAGVRLVNGEELKAPLTVVSEGSLYVQGDYNTENKKGAAVLADAVNLLSNAWTDTKGAGSLPAASETTYNMAIVTGNHETKVGGYNGGFENLPRFHEKWSGVDCNIVGSFVNTWSSKFATGTWLYGSDRYQAPGRIWSYDEDFNVLGNLPPFTPMAVTAEPVVTW